jgi:hypothetical protein
MDHIFRPPMLLYLWYEAQGPVLSFGSLNWYVLLVPITPVAEFTDII